MADLHLGNSPSSIELIGFVNTADADALVHGALIDGHPPGPLREWRIPCPTNRAVFACAITYPIMVLTSDGTGRHAEPSTDNVLRSASLERIRLSL